MIAKLITFLIKKRVTEGTQEFTEVSKTKIFMLLEGILQMVEFVAPYFGNPVIIPDEVHKGLWSLAGLSYAERQVKK